MLKGKFKRPLFNLANFGMNIYDIINLKKACFEIKVYTAKWSTLLIIMLKKSECEDKLRTIEKVSCELMVAKDPCDPNTWI